MAKKYSGDKTQIAATDAYVKLMRAADTVQSSLARNAENHGLTISQFGVLEALLHLGGMRQKELAQKILKSGGNLSRVIDNLEKRKLVRREADPGDRRAFIIQLTNEGKSLIESLFPTHMNDIYDFFSVLEIKELQELAGYCKRIGLAAKKTL